MTDRIPGVVVGIVSTLEDPDGLGRLRVRFPWMANAPESAPCRVAAPLAGPENGAWFPPELEAEALIAFEQGDVNRPY
ncbi:MAG: phage baseplate assembly protein V, partial [Pseudomonadota bacterium]